MFEKLSGRLFNVCWTFARLLYLPKCEFLMVFAFVSVKVVVFEGVNVCERVRERGRERLILMK